MSRPTYLGIIDVHDMMLALLAEIKDSSSVRSPAEWTAELKKIEDTFLNRMLITVIGHGDGELLFNARLGTSLFETVRAGFLTGAANRKSVGCAARALPHRDAHVMRAAAQLLRRGADSPRAPERPHAPCAGGTART